MGKLLSIGGVVALLCVVFGTWKVSASGDGACMYNKCAYKFLGYGSHEPCMNTGGRSLIRNVECEDGNTIHICCKMPYRDDIQKSRQKWFRFVTDSGSKISVGCTKRILCEQSCKDGLKGLARYDYPEVLADDTPENREYVEAYTQGERESCYNHNKTSNDKDTQKEGLYDSKMCEENCNIKYPECDHDLDNSLLTECYYMSSTAFHQLGMWSFTAEWLVRDTIDKAVEMTIPAGQAVKKAYQLLYDRMSSMNDAFMNWLESEQGKQEDVDGGRKRREASAQDIITPSTEQWNQFLVIYNETDFKLVEAVYESLNYTEYGHAMDTINGTLFTYDFGPGEWIENGSGSFVPSIFIIIWFILHNMYYLCTV